MFEGEGWGIIIDDGYEGRGYREGAVYGTHQACTKDYDPGCEDEVRYSYGENCWEPTGKSYKSNAREDTGTVAECYLCDAAVPKGIQALILLQGWNNKGER